MNIYIAADHRGFERKELLKEHLKKAGLKIIDLGDTKLNADDDFTEFAQDACLAVLADESDKTEARGILICGSGQGMMMAANRFRGIRACLAFSEHQAMAARREEDSNVLCLSSEHLNLEKTISIVESWLKTKFLREQRYIRRIEQLDKL
jgi:ribose 5-phosphate isomerase B